MPDGAVLRVLILTTTEMATARSPHNSVFVLHQAQALAEAGVDVQALTAGALPFRWPPALKTKAEVDTIGGIEISRYFRPLAYPFRWRTAANRLDVQVESVRRGLASFIRRNGRPDLLHAHFTFWAGAAAGVAAVEHQLPFVITEHGSRFALHGLTREEWQIACTAFQRARGVAAVSAALSDRLSELMGGFRVETIPNVLDPHFERAPLGGQSSGKVRLVSVGRLDVNKNHLSLIEAFDHAGLAKDADLVIVGDGSQRGPIEKAIRRRGISGSVSLPGRLSRENLVRLMQGCHGMVHPSKYETFGVVLIEAMALGLPVLAVESDGTRSLVDHQNGLLLRDGSVPALAGALREFVERVRTYDKPAIRAATVGSYGARAVAGQLTRFYNRAVG